MIKKADIFLGIFLIILCLSSLLLLQSADGAGSAVVITVDGKLYGTYDLADDRRIEIDQSATGIGGSTGAEHHNVAEIRDGAVVMVESDCSNQLCVHQGAIRRTNQTIVCLPNRVVVSISGSDSIMDAVAY